MYYITRTLPWRAHFACVFALALLALLWTGTAGATTTRPVGDLPPLPEAVASFGAAVADDHLYVYGGHVGKRHQHSIENLSHRFLRLDLRDPANGWQDLGEVDGRQGLPLVALGDEVCRIGGLTARNHRDSEEEDLVSLAEVACFTLQTGTWRELPPLPAPRSSHDAVVLDGRIFVVGGWRLSGTDNASVWHHTMAVLDPAAEAPVWRSIPQPFERRALAVAAAGGKVYAFGGLDSEGTRRDVHIFDPATETWRQGPEMPSLGGRLKGFGVSAFGVGERIFLSGADGIVHAFDTTTGTWSERMAKLATPRFFHRLLPHGQQLVVLGGAAEEGHLDSLEVLEIAALVPGSVPPGPIADDEKEVSTAETWPGFRGHGDGRVQAAVPMHWSSERNVAWRAPLPGYGQSSPVIWGDQVFVTSVEGANKEHLILSSLSLATGEIRWRRRFAAGRTMESSKMVSRGAPTPTVDAERLYAFWESGDLIALDHEGETLWQRSLTDEYGAFEGNHGVASSPLLTDAALVVQVTHAGPSYFLAVDKATGGTLWKADRPAGVAWTSPVSARNGDGSSVIISSAAGRVEAIDPNTGERIWSLDGLEKNHVPSALVAGERVIVPSSDPGQTLALRLGGHGALDESAIVWRAEDVTSGFGSPLAQGDCILFVNKSGTVSCLDRESGALRWRHRIADACWASPIGAGDDVYFFTKKGTTVVLRPEADGPIVIAENELPTEGTVYGVAAARDAFVIRTGSEIVRVGGVAEVVEVANGSRPEENPPIGRLADKSPAD